MRFWIKHPRSKEPDTMLTFSFWSLLVCLFKFLTSGAKFSIGSFVWEWGLVDAAAVGVILGATLSAYVARKWKSPPKNKADNNEKR